jgi:hypothetical protein
MGSAMSVLNKERIREILTHRRRQNQSSASKFFAHPAILLLLGFLFTGVVGGLLANYWKAREWENQQRYLAKQRGLEKKYAVIDEALKAVAETNTAAEDVLAGYSWTEWHQKEADQRRENWLATSRKWRISSKIVRQKLAAYFVNPDVLSQFDQIISTRRQVGNIITNLLTRSIKSEKEAQEERKRALELVNKIGEQLKQCGSLMARELAQP